MNFRLAAAWRLRRVAIVIALIFALMPAAGAQTAADSSSQMSAAQSGPTASQLQEVVVTAEKRPQRLEDVPASLIVLNGDQLLSQGADTLEDYVARVPGLSMNSMTLGQQQLSIRGLSTGPQYAPTVAVYMDDAPVGASNGDGAGGLITPDIDSIDLARIEVLRGPQGTLYGSSNIGGLVRYVTVAPDPKQVDAVVELDGDTLSHGGSGYDYKARVNIPVIPDRVALLVSGYDRLDPGFISDAALGRQDVNEDRTRGWRIALLATPIDGLSINGAALGQDQDANGFPEVDVNPLTLQPLYGDYQQRRARGAEYYRTGYRLYYVTIDYDLGWSKFTETTSYNMVTTDSSQDYTGDFAPLFDSLFNVPDLGYAAAYNIAQNRLTEEARLSGTIVGRLDWMIGGYYDHENSNTIVTAPTFNSITGAPINLGTLLDAITLGHYLARAGFGQLTYHVTPRLSLTLGGRYEGEGQNDLASTSGLLVGPQTVIPSSEDDNATTYTVSPSYKLTRDLMAYARVATGFRPGGANGGYAPQPTYGPDHVVDYEAGFKGHFPDRRLTFGIDGFYVDWTGVQLQLMTSTGLEYTADAGKASSDGFEGNITYAPLQELTLEASATYIDAHLDRDIVSGSSYGLKGDPLPYSPPWKVALSGDYAKPIGSGWVTFLGASFFYTGQVAAQFAISAAAPRIELPSYTTVDARWGVMRDHWTVALIGKNLFDERGFNGVTPLTLNPTGATALTMIQPRALILSVTYNYR
jgi:iron complex outermembrane recepter protein